MTAARGTLGKTHRLRNGFRLRTPIQVHDTEHAPWGGPAPSGGWAGLGRGRPQPRPKRLPPAVENVGAVESSLMHRSRRTRVKMLLAAAVF